MSWFECNDPAASTGGPMLTGSVPGSGMAGLWPRSSMARLSFPAALIVLLGIMCCGAELSQDWVSLSQLPSRPSPRMLNSLTSIVSNQSQTPAECLNTQLLAVAQQCTSGGVAGSLRDNVIKLLQRCLLYNVSGHQQPVRILTVQGNVATLIQNAASLYSQLVGYPVVVDAIPLFGYTKARLLSTMNPTNLSITHQAWLVTPSAFGDGLASGAFMDVTDLVASDRRLKLETLLPMVRTDGIVYNSQVLGLPLSSYSTQLYYRKDIFDQMKWPIPRTWRELAILATLINGTVINGTAYSAMGLAWGPCQLMGTGLFRYIMASVTQTRGPKQGWLIDGDTQQLLTGTVAMEETITVMRAMFEATSIPDRSLFYTGPEGPCSTPAYPFEQGLTLMSISVPSTFKYVAHSSRAAKVGQLQGNLGVALLPGSDVVLDRATNTLVPCDANRCPYATKYKKPDGTSYWVNHSPAFDGNVLVANAQAPPQVRFFSYSVASYLASPTPNDGLVFERNAEIYPSRTTQLDPNLWASAGFNLKDAQQTMAAHQLALSHPNVNVQVRIPGAGNLVSLFGEISNNATGNFSTPARSIAGTAQDKATAILLAAFKGDWSAAIAAYKASINAPTPGSGVAPDGSPLTVLSPDDAKQQKTRTIIIGAACGGPALLLIIGLIMWARWRLQRGGSGSAGHPGPGPLTTLLITDIQDSTTLWENLDASVMDMAAKVHNVVIRRMAAKYNGYESAWEGDSFILAFPSPMDALNFSLEVQGALLAKSWPPKLLMEPAAAEQWLCPCKGADPAMRPSDPAALMGIPAMSATSAQLTTPQLTPQLTAEVLPHAPSATEPSAASLPPGLSEELQTMFIPKQSLDGASSDHSSLSPRIHAHSIHSNPLFNPTPSNPLPPPMSSASPPIPSSPSNVFNPSSNTMSSPSNIFNAGGSGMAYPQSPSITGMNNNPLVQVHEDLPMVSYPTLSQVYANTWKECEPNAPGAILAHRGLRVRVGMHAGVANASDINYNNTMGRYHYTGRVRVLANAIASSGHGGQTIISLSTLLGPNGRFFNVDSKANNQALPPEARVFNMGTHVLDEAGEEAWDLVCIMPRALLCRMALPQLHNLRKTRFLLPGCMRAPIGQMPVYVACLQLQGLGTLFSWNSNETIAAVTKAQACALEAAGEFGGVVSEDSWAVMAIVGKSVATASATGLPGCLMVVFPYARSAMAWILQVRYNLLMLDWSESLLGHSACERVGNNPAPGVQARWRAMEGANQRSESKSNPGKPSERNPSHTAMGFASGSLKPAATAASLDPADRAQSVESGGVADVDDAFPMYNDDAVSYTSSSITQSTAASPFERVMWQGGPGSFAPGPGSQYGGHAGAPSVARSSEPNGASIASFQSAQLHQRLGLLPTDISPQRGAAAGKSGNAKHLSKAARNAKHANSLAAHLKVMLKKSKDAGGSTDGEELFVQDAPFLRGLRVKGAVVTSSASSVSITLRSFGHATYSSHAMKKLARQLKLTTAGQVVTKHAILQEAAHGIS